VNFHARFRRDCRDIPDRLDRSGFIIGLHDRDQDRLLRDRRTYRFEVDAAVTVNRQDGDLRSLGLEKPQRSHDRFMLDRAGDEVIAGATGHVPDTLEG
jgi:hypothetical protein